MSAARGRRQQQPPVQPPPPPRRAKTISAPGDPQPAAGSWQRPQPVGARTNSIQTRAKPSRGPGASLPPASRETERQSGAAGETNDKFGQTSGATEPRPARTTPTAARGSQETAYLNQQSGGPSSESLAESAGGPHASGDYNGSNNSNSNNNNNSNSIEDNTSNNLDAGPLLLPTAGFTRNLAWAVLAAAVGSSFQHGYNNGVMNAPERLIGDFINDTYKQRANATGGNPAAAAGASEAQVDLVFAVMVSIFCVGGCAGALLTALVADRLGRKEGLLYNNLLVLLACPMMASARALASYELLIAGRLLIGVNAGLNAGLAPLYLNEIAPVELRGALGTIYQLVITVSILLSNVFGLPGLLGNAAAWPILFVIPILPAAFMLAVLPNLCESPKFLLLNQGKELQAQQALAWFRQTSDVHDEMEELRNERELQRLVQNSNNNNNNRSLRDMFTEPSLRRPLTIAIVIMLSQQLSGINAVLFYSTSIFRDAGLSQAGAVRATLGMGLVNVLMTLVSLFLVDRAGRRTLHMTGLMGMAAACLVLAICIGGAPAAQPQQPATPSATSLNSVLSVGAVYAFIAMFASGPGAIPWFLVAELFPSAARPVASSIAVAVNWLANFVVSLCFLPLSNVLHGYTFLVFAALLVVFYLFTYYKVPETKGATAEEISALFRR